MTSKLSAEERICRTLPNLDSDMKKALKNRLSQMTDLEIEAAIMKIEKMARISQDLKTKAVEARIRKNRSDSM